MSEKKPGVFFSAPVRLILLLLLYMVCVGAACSLVYLNTQDDGRLMESRPLRTHGP